MDMTSFNNPQATRGKEPACKLFHAAGCGTATGAVSTSMTTHGSSSAPASPTRLAKQRTSFPWRLSSCRCTDGTTSVTSNAAAPRLMSPARASSANPGKRTAAPHAATGAEARRRGARERDAAVGHEQRRAGVDARAARVAPRRDAEGELELRVKRGRGRRRRRSRRSSAAPWWRR